MKDLIREYIYIAKDFSWSLRLLFVLKVAVIGVILCLKYAKFDSFDDKSQYLTIQKNENYIVSETSQTPLYGLSIFQSKLGAQGQKYSLTERINPLKYRLDKVIENYKMMRQELPILGARMAHIDKQIMILRPQHKPFLENIRGAMMNFKTNIGPSTGYSKYFKRRVPKMKGTSVFYRIKINSLHKALDQIEISINRERMALVRNGKSDPTAVMALWDPYIIMMNNNYKMMMESYVDRYVDMQAGDTGYDEDKDEDEYEGDEDDDEDNNDKNEKKKSKVAAKSKPTMMRRPIMTTPMSMDFKTSPLPMPAASSMKPSAPPVSRGFRPSPPSMPTASSMKPSAPPVSMDFKTSPPPMSIANMSMPSQPRTTAPMSGPATKGALLAGPKPPPLNDPDAFL